MVGGPNSIESSMKAARAALMLIPILGVHFILLPMRPASGSALENIYLIASAIASSYQVQTIFFILRIPTIFYSIKETDHIPIKWIVSYKRANNK